MVAVLLVDVGLAIYILPKDPAMDLFIYSDGVQVDFTIGGRRILNILRHIFSGKTVQMTFVPCDKKGLFYIFPFAAVKQ